MEDKQHVPFDELLEDRTKEGTKLQTSEYSADGLHPIIDQGQKDIAGYTDREDGIFPVVPCIVFGDHTRVIKYVDKPFFLGADGVKVLCPKTASNNTKYLYYALNSVKIPDTGYNRHYKWLKEARITVYSKEKQDKLVSIFELIDDLISLRKKQLQKLDDLVESRFVEMFGDPEINPMEWPIEVLGDLLSVEPQNGLYKSQSDYIQNGTGTPILRIDAFYNGKVTDFSALKRLNCTDVEKERYLLKENDIVINRVNSIEYLGKCAWITGMLEPTVFESNMMRFHIDETRIDPCYVTRLLCSSFIYNQILNRAKKAVNQASINQGDVQSFKILVPPILLQKQFTVFVAQVDKSKLTVQQGLDKLELLKQSLMQKYFG